MTDTNPSRRGALRMLGAAPALAVIPAVMVADPAFAAIDRHRTARAAFNVECGRFDDIDEPTDTDEDAYEAANLAESHALADLANTRPTTAKGAMAALRHLSKVQGETHRGVSMLEVFAASLITAKWPT